MEYYGYAGKICHVDLTSSEIKEYPLDLKLAKKFIGGQGINNRLIFDLLKPYTDPYSPDNPIVIGVGPLCGTVTPMASKVAVTTKMPIFANNKKHGIGTGMGGNKRFGAMIKNAGYDHIVITGKARKHSYLKITDDNVEICNASDIWGKDIYETSDELSERHRGRTGKAGVWAIGQAGENLVRWSMGIADKKGSLGSMGIASVLGSKNLKAVVALGTKGIKVAKPDKFMAVVNDKRREIISHPAWGGGHKSKWGTIKPELPVLFDCEGDYSPDEYEKSKDVRSACMGCLDACRQIFVIRDGKFENTMFQTGHAWCALQFGRMLQIEDYRETLKLNDLFNRYGVSQFTASRMLYFITKMFERGVISEKDTGGLVLKTGDFACYVKLLDKIVNRRDIGEIIADGWYSVYQKIGVDPGTDPEAGFYIMKGADCIADPRYTGFGPGIGMPEMVGIKAMHVHGPTHFPAAPDLQQDTRWPFYERTLNDVMIACKERYACTNDEIEHMFTRDDFNIGKLTKHAEDARGLYNSMGICDSGHRIWEPMANIPLLSELYSAVTGIEMSARKLKEIGERVWNTEKLLNVREGFIKDDDEIGGIILNNLETLIKIPNHGRFPGEHYLLDWFGRRISKEDIQKMLQDYYTERGWDIDKGIPTKEKITQLGLEELLQ